MKLLRKVWDWLGSKFLMAELPEWRSDRPLWTPSKWKGDTGKGYAPRRVDHWYGAYSVVDGEIVGYFVSGESKEDKPMEAP